MTPDQIDRVFGHGRLKMVTGEHVEVFREGVAPGERRRYTKRFLNTTNGNFAHWTEREWRILARLIGHGIGCVPDVVQFDRGSVAGTQLVQTYDAGVTVDQWATLLPLLRNGQVYRHVFEDCAHWWALAHHCLVALNAIHQLQLVHLDIKGDNVCIPLGPAGFDPYAPGLRLHPMFGQLALIDFAFALVSRESLTTPLPIGWQKEYDYQSPRLLKALEEGRNGDLRPTGELDWRCDMYSLAAMLKRYLPDEGMVHEPERATGWSSDRYDAAKALILTLRDHHDRDAPQLHPHEQLIEATGARLREDELALSLASGWTLARDVSVAPVGASPLTPMTRLAPSIRVYVSPHDRVSTHAWAAIAAREETTFPLLIPQRDDPVRPNARGARVGPVALASATVVALIAGAALAIFPDAARMTLDDARSWLAGAGRQSDSMPNAGDNGKRSNESAAPGTTNERVADAAPSATPDATEGPPAATAAPAVDSGAQDTAPGDRISEPALQPQRESSDSRSVVPRARDVTPPLAPTRPKPAPSANAAVPASGKRVATKSVPPTPTRTATPMASVKSPLPSTSVPPASRPEMQARRGAPKSPLYSSVVASASTEQRPRVEPATAHGAPPAPLPSERTPSQPLFELVQQPATQPIPPSTEAVVEIPKTAPAPEVRASPAPIPPSTAQRERAPSASEERRWTGLFSLLFGRAGRASAPIEDRHAQSPAPPPAQASRAAPPPPLAPSQDRVAQVSPNLIGSASASSGIAIASPAVPTAPSQSQPSQSPGPAIRDDARPPSPPKVEEKPPRAEPSAGEPGLALPDASRALVPPSWNAAPRVLPPPRAMPESSGESLSPARARENAFAMQARRTLAQATPQIAMQMQNEVARVLWVAATAYDPRQDRGVLEAARAVSLREDASQFMQDIDLGEAQRLNKEALQAYWIRRNVAEAFDLQLKAFGANPRDPEIAGNLAFLHLKMSPVQPETARQLALHAIAFRGSRFRMGRIDDWNTFALASALTGRNIDAKNALFVTVALATDVERNCVTALNAIATYGERLREPAEAMLYRIYTQGRGVESRYCAWPPNRAVGMRSQ